MATTKIYLDTRGVQAGSPAPLKVAINKKSSTAFISLNIKLLPKQWDAKSGKVVNHPNKSVLNTYIGSRKQEIDNLLMRLTMDGELAGLTATEIKNRIASELNPDKEIEKEKPLFAAHLLRFAGKKEKPRTKELYLQTYNHLKSYMGAKLETLTFEGINKEWLTDFDPL